MDMFEQSILLLCLAMVLAIGIERLLEILRAVRDHLDAKDSDKVGKYWYGEAERIGKLIEVRMNNAVGKDSAFLYNLLIAAGRYLAPAESHSSSQLVVSATRVRELKLKIRYKLFAILLGILFACAFDLNIFRLVDQSLGVDSARRIPEVLGLILSGIAMGFGADPVHKLITALEKARKKRR
ncbi:MAG: hypothetical protein OEY07_07380 [Gammaproteobacteria bacterium]|nr:hypothetical protein [Gammaproteobacteria bacterium]